MTGINKRFILGTSIALFLAASPAWAQSAAEPLSKSEVAAIGHLVVKAAHFSAQEPRLVRYEVTSPKTYRAPPRASRIPNQPDAAAHLEERNRRLELLVGELLKANQELRFKMASLERPATQACAPFIAVSSR